MKVIHADYFILWKFADQYYRSFNGLNKFDCYWVFGIVPGDSWQN